MIQRIILFSFLYLAFTIFFGGVEYLIFSYSNKAFVNYLHIRLSNPGGIYYIGNFIISFILFVFLMINYFKRYFFKLIIFFMSIIVLVDIYSTTIYLYSCFIGNNSSLVWSTVTTLIIFVVHILLLVMFFRIYRLSYT